MKQTSKILSIILAITILLAMPITAQASFKVTSPYTSSKYTINDNKKNKTILHGIDVSEHNGNINWKEVNKNVDFAIIRIGYRGYGKSGAIIKDKKFDENIKKAKENGIPVGIYFYSQAVTTTEAMQEANSTIQWLKDEELDFPIFYDYEFASVSSGRLDSAWRTGKLNKTKMTNNALAFMDAIHSTGYDAMIYASRCFLVDNVDNKTITDNGYGIWVAEYNTSTPFEGKYVGWQYSSSGHIDGISGKIDCNFWFVDDDDTPKFIVDDVDDTYYTGEEICPQPQVYANNTLLEQDKDYTLSYSKNESIGTANVTITGIGEYEQYRAKTLYYKILPSTVENLTFTARTTNSLSVKWDNEEGSEYDIQIYRSGKWVNYASLTNNHITITGLTPASIYNVRVRVRKKVSGIYYYGKYSASVKQATIPDKMASPTSTPYTNSVNLSWKKQGNASGYEIYKYDYSSKAYYLLATTSSLSYTDKGLTPNTANKYRIRAYKTDADGSALYGAYCSGITTYTNPATPKTKKATSPKKRSIKLTWNKVNSVTGYEVQWSTSSNFSNNKRSVIVKGASTVSKTIQTSKSNKKYFVRVRSYKTRNGKTQYSKWSKALSVKAK